MKRDAGQELEVKFYLTDLEAFRKRVEAQGGRLVQPRLHEVNLRFDTPDGELSRTFQVLRLRQDTAARLTYKGPGETTGGVRARREIEFTVGDFEAARSFLEALGYHVRLMYEKYRTTYELEGVLVTQDEMPYGNFTELEGPDPESIQSLARKLGMYWEARILESYTFLFERLRESLGFSFRDLSFENFSGKEVTPAALGVRPADR
jgi:adenylate cyclase class 2